METPQRIAVRNALNELKPYLSAYVEQVRGPGTFAVSGTKSLAQRQRPVSPRDADITALVGVILDEWRERFSEKLASKVRTYLVEVRDIRNRWAHEEPFDDDDRDRAIDTIRQVAKAIGHAGFGTPTVKASPERRPAIVPDRPARTSGTGPQSPVRKDSDGVIVNAEELDVASVVNQRVLCPGCRGKIFAQWPAGWDAHAAHSCLPSLGRTAEDRKAEYKRQFRTLFR